MQLTEALDRYERDHPEGFVLQHQHSPSTFVVVHPRTYGNPYDLFTSGDKRCFLERGTLTLLTYLYVGQDAWNYYPQSLPFFMAGQLAS